MSKKIFCFALAAIMVLGCFVGCSPKENQPKNENKVIVGNITEMSGDFRWPGFDGGAPAASDQDVTKLTVGYGTMELDQSGKYVWNKTVVKSHSEEEDKDGNLVITIEINPGLKFSDGSEVKAQNYLAYILACSTKVAVNAKSAGTAGLNYVGFDEFNKYVGEDVKVEGASKEFKGVRLLSDYKFSVAVKAPDFYPYYFAKNYGAQTPNPLGLVLGDDVEVKDDGNGAYLTEKWYEKAEDSKPDALTFVKTKHLTEARYDTTKYPYSGPYMIKNYDKGTKEAVLELNPNFAGDFAGQKPSIKTIVYTKIVEETQLEQLKTGAIDVMSNVTGGKETKEALDMMKGSEGKFKETHYQRAGYGKIQFECDFGPTMFAEVRQAVAYLLNRAEFCQTFTGGYGVVVDGPYSPDFAMYKAVKDDLNITKYEFSPANAKAVLEKAGWVYNSKGEKYVEGAEGVDAVRYKKLEGDALNDVNKKYATVANTDGVTYKTVKVGNDYYMPLAINWFGSQPNTVTDLLTTTLSNSKDLAAAGMVIRSTTGDFTALVANINRNPEQGFSGTPTYGMYNLATGWNTSDYDYAFNWSLDPNFFPYSVNKLFDEYDKAFPYEKNKGLSLEEAMKKSDGKLGMDYLSMSMVYTAKTEDEYNQWWKAYIERWNYLQPDIPLYSNYYYDIFNSKIVDYKTGPFWNPMQALVYAHIENAE